MREPVIVVKNLNKTFTIREKAVRSIRGMVLNFSDFRHKKHTVPALRNINFEVQEGEIIGIIGRNGSGKSTLLNLLIGSMKPDKSSVLNTKGKIIRLALGMGFDPNLSARHNIYVNGSILGLTFRKIGQIFHDIIAFADLEDFVDTPIKFYSSGMRSRLAFSIAIYAEADIFLMDEVFGGVGDVNFREKSKKVFEDAFLDKRTILFVSHSLTNILEFSDKVLLIDRGQQLAFGNPTSVVQQYQKLMKEEK